MTISSTELNSITCHHCKIRFADKEQVVQISSAYFSEENMEYFTMMYQDKASRVSVDRCVNFHTVCFMEIAGEDFVP